MYLEDAHRKVSQAIHDLAEPIIQLSHKIHDNPETSLNEHQAAQWITEFLSERGFRVRKPLAGMDTAFLGEMGAEKPVVAFLLEYDALPEIGHACGHNLIAAGGLAAGAALASLGTDLPGTVQVIGTPGEEKDGGKIIELEAGVFTEVDAALMFHPGSTTMMWRHSTAVVELTVQFHGVAAHAAGSPQQGRNALAAMIQFFVAVDGMRQHIAETSRLHGIIRHGGSAANVIPDFTEAEMLVRAITSDDTRALLERVRACAEGAALATGCTVTFAEGPLYSERKNNHTLATRVGEYLQSLGHPLEEPILKGGTGSSDIGNVSLAIPAIHPYLAIAPQGTPGHSIRMRDYAGSDEAQQAMLHMAEALAHAGVDLMFDPDFLALVKSEFAVSGPDLPA
ncbi:MAG: amidohydrolase [Sulfobacillus acidophilus]|uniref:Peptidase M20 domain-containing protein 2 n=1 Tax=Sulfobacillus acidophilus TaxID=53633 RepID=A0A2T2WLC0_9FIRM|nr:MAG: amidohydrolase [Sulfobacillus acidophilus]